jgi:hypothetical protein
VAIADWYTFVLECDLERNPAGAGWRASACSRPPDDVGARYEEGAPTVSLSHDAIRIDRRIVAPALGFFDRWRAFAFGSKRAEEDSFSVPIHSAIDIREGDTLRASRDAMGGRHVTLKRGAGDASAAIVWAFDDPEARL